MSAFDSPMRYEEITERLKSLSNPESVGGMAQFGIKTENTYGTFVLTLRKIARETHRAPGSTALGVGNPRGQNSCEHG